MIKQDGFIEKFLNRLNKIDQVSLEKYILSINKEKDFVYSILNNLTEGILIINPQGIVTFSNAKAKDILMRSVSEDRPFMDNIFEDESLREFIKKHFSSTLRAMNYCIEVLKPKPSQLRISFIPIFDDNQNMVSFLVILHDMAVDYEIEACQRDKNVESLVKLAAGLAHEIGNPLNTIHIYLKLIAQEVRKSKNKKIEDWIKVVSDETERLDKIVKNFLDVTRTRVTLFKKGNINECIENAAHFLLPRIKENNIKIKVSLEKSIPYFYIDNDKMYEVFLNIFKNAIEAMPNGGELQVSSFIKGNLVNITCRDSGIGIDEDDLPNIFDAYFTKKAEGSGLGLMNVHNIVKAHHGRIHVQSKTGEGTIVIVTLPIRRGKLQLPHIKTSKRQNEDVKE